ncbi:hypothetical protein [Nesterenkonia sp. F]|uniref:hypothetical protein n=1 Tax=Nesterenkonia sp. F TaxID=795955 RepID=UPI000255C8F5|nr:hypothetical protein [Nesterenkonia sp. F]
MRHVLSAICLVLAGLLAAASTAGQQVDQLLREPEPIREIAGQLPADEAFADAVSERIADDAAEQLPAGISGLVGSGLENLVSSAVSDLLEDEDARAAWEESLQSTRADYADQLEAIFHDGAAGEAGELAVSLDLTPVAQVLVGRIPMVGEETAEQLAPEIVVDVDPVSDSGADAYGVATLAQASSHWSVAAIAAGVLAVLGLLAGRGRGRWMNLALGGLAAAGVGLVVALGPASPDPPATAGASPASAAVVEHVADEFAAWAQPTWWLFLAGAGVVVVGGLVGLLAARGQRGVDGDRSGPRGEGPAVHHPDHSAVSQV